MDKTELARVLRIPNLSADLDRVEKLVVKTASSADVELRMPLVRMAGSPGKRLRAIFVLAAASIQGKRSDETVTAAAAVELIHLASLVHDDIIDKADTRRGVRTINCEESDDIALLAGDYLLAAGLTLAAEVSPEAASTLGRAVTEMSAGQAAELNHGGELTPLGKEHMKVAAQKTGALIGASCQIGGICSHMSSDEISALGKFGESFGVAFQIMDDLTDGDIRTQDAHKALDATKALVRTASYALRKFRSPQAVRMAGLPEIYLERFSSRYQPPQA